MNEPIQYCDQDGNPISLLKLVRTEPEWAVNVIAFYAKKVRRLEEEIETLLHACDRVEGDEDE